ncbi:MAG: hypothetical protein WCI74_16920 [Actinomycetes bacterium]
MPEPIVIYTGQLAADQWASVVNALDVVMFAGALCVFLLAVVAVGSWRR